MAYRRDLLMAGALLTAVMLLAGAAAALAGPEGDAPAGRAAISKDMVFWLHWDQTSPTVNGKATQLTFNTTQYWTKTNYTIDGDKNLEMDFYLVPALAGAVTMNGTVVLGLWGNYSGSNNNFQLQTIIYERNATGSENWTSSTYSNAYAPASSPQFYTFSFTNFLHTFAAGSTIHLNIQVTGGSGIYKAIYVDTATNNSRITFPCQDYMAVAGLNTLDSLGNPQGGFSSTTNNTTVIVRSTITDPFGGYDIRWSNLTLTGPDQTVILDNQTMTKVAGSPVSFSNAYELSWNFSGRPPGRYNITLWAVDNNGYYYYYYFMNYNYGYYILTNTSFFFIGTPRYVNVMALDSTGVPLSEAEVAATVLESVIDRNFTDPAGMTNLSMQSGVYNMRVFWKGVMVADEPVNITDNVSAQDPLIIHCAVYYPNFAIVDSRGAALVDAAVYMHYPNGTASILPYRTNITGEFSIDRAARGLYELSVVWGGLEVNRTIILVNGNVTYTVVCDVFYLKVRLVDPHLGPVPNARVVITDNSTGIVADSRMTDQDGSVESRLPRHFYDITAYWNEAVVNTTYHVRVYADGQVELVCAIYYFTVLAVDSRDIPITDAQGVVSFSANGKVMDSKFTDEEGSFVIRAPAGLYDISIYWQDILVFNGIQVAISADSMFTARCSVYYLTISAVDSHGVPLANAHVQMYDSASGSLLDAKSSDTNGNLTSRLPATTVYIMTSWQDTLVNTTHHVLLRDDNLVLHCRVYYLMITAQDDRGVPVQNAQVRLSFASGGKLLDVQTTDYDGVAVSRLPAGLLSITAYWQDTLVNETPLYDLGSDSELVMGCMVYYLQVLSLDSRSVPLEYAFVRVSVVGGRLAESPVSGSDGTVTVRVPVGSVNVSVTWSNVLVGELTMHQVNSSHMLIVACSVYYTEVIITDSRDAAVPNAAVTFLLGSDKQMAVKSTGLAGNATFRLPSELYKITVVWQEQLVSPEADFRADHDGQFTLKCKIYYLTVRPVDSMNKPLENATVVFKQDLTGNVLDTLVTGADGSVTARLPIGFHTLKVSWQDVEVKLFPGYNLTADSSATLDCMVFYLTARPLDASGVPLAVAEVTAFPAGRSDVSTTLTTDSAGAAVFRLPAQAYDLRVSWKGVQVCSRPGYTLSGNAGLTLNCRVYYLTVKIVDRDGKGLAGVQMTVFTLKGGLIYEVAGSAATNSSSKCVFRLPVGDYKVVANLRTTYYMTPVDMTSSKTVGLQETANVTITFGQYPLPIYTTNGFLIGLLLGLFIAMAVATVYYVYRRFGRGAPPAGTSAAAVGAVVAGEKGPEGEETGIKEETGKGEDEKEDEKKEDGEETAEDEDEEEPEEAAGDDVESEDEEKPVPTGTLTEPPKEVAPAQPLPVTPAKSDLPDKAHEGEISSEKPAPPAETKPSPPEEPEKKNAIENDEIDKLLKDL